MSTHDHSPATTAGPAPRIASSIVASLVSCVVFCGAVQAASVTGTVTGPDGKPFRAAFVQARNTQMKMTVSVLSDNDGRYHIDNLPAGDYRFGIRAIGFKSDAKRGVTLAADQAQAADFALQKGVVAWSDLSIDQGHQLLPEAPGKKQLFASCMGCHGFQTKMANGLRDEEGWRDRVNYMRTAMSFSLGIARRPFTDAQAEEVVSYLNHVFGYDSDKVMPKSPADLPGYATLVRPVPDEALRIVYVTYDMPGPGRMPWTAAPDKDGKFWIAEYGNANKIARLDPVSGEMVEFRVPNPNSAAIHSAVPAPDGSVWLTERGEFNLGRWDPKTQQVEEFKDTWDKHTARVALDGTVWSTGGMTKFDPKTKTFTHIAEVPNVYGLAVAKDGTLWFAENKKDGHIGKIDPVTNKVTKYFTPTTQQPRRIQVAQDGMIWFAGLSFGRIAKFDPASEKFTEFALPGPHASPYALGITDDYQIWYSSEHQDVVGRLDPASAKVVEYPIPFSDNGMRDFFKDAKGHLWFGSPPNDLVGYFYLADK